MSMLTRPTGFYRVLKSNSRVLFFSTEITAPLIFADPSSELKKNNYQPPREAYSSNKRRQYGYAARKPTPIIVTKVKGPNVSSAPAGKGGNAPANKTPVLCPTITSSFTNAKRYFSFFSPTMKCFLMCSRPSFADSDDDDFSSDPLKL